MDQSGDDNVANVEQGRREGSEAEDTLYIGWSGCRATRSGELTVAGAGFAAEDEIRVRVDGELVDVVDSEVDGTFATTVDCEPGTHTAKVSDTENRSLTFSAFTCQAA